MENQTIQATLRGKQTQGELTRMRKSGQTAVTFSGQGLVPVSLYASTLELENMLLLKPRADVVVAVGFDGQSHLTHFTQIDRHPISKDLLTVSLTKIVAD